MPDINLIRGRRDEERRASSTARQLCVCLIIAFAAGALGFSILAAKTAVLKGEIRGLEAQLTAQKPTLDKIEQARKEKTALKPKLDLLADCQEEIFDWHAICCSLSQRLSPETWLTSLDIEDVKGKGQQEGKLLKINGMAFTHTRVGETMLALNTVPEFAKLELESTKRAEVENEKVLEFELAATLPERSTKGTQGAEGAESSASGTG